MHVVVIEGGAVVLGEVWSPDDADALAVALRDMGVARAAVDAPDAPSSSPHAHDGALSTKFRAGRCGEIALGREHRIWVSWVTPSAPPFSAWMATGFRLHAALRRADIASIETYPHAVFRLLAGARLASKSTPAGVRARVEVLRRAGLEAGPHLAMWSHDALDAAAAALVAADQNARSVTCGHDGSAIWVPGYVPAR